MKKIYLKEKLDKMASLICIDTLHMFANFTRPLYKTITMFGEFEDVRS